MSAFEVRLPPLREDLQLLAGPAALDGSPTWTIHDPARNRYFRIGWAAFQMLSRWSLGTLQALIAVVHSTTTCRLSNDDVLAFIKFLYANSLTVGPPGDKVSAYLEQYLAGRPRWHRWLIHNYLFFRVPLVRPEGFLRATLPLVSWLYSKWVATAVLAAGAFGLYFVSRQWDTFHATFLHFFSPDGAVLYALALIGAMVLHELGHAYTAVRYGCRVPSMGVALLVLFPVLYTDVTDAWRLASRRQRLAIGAAGMLTELGIAALSTLAWSFMPEGPWRSAAFILATVTWVMTLAINLSPFMRFDGYYLLADWWGVDNLQSRAFSLARWKLRQLLFSVPEQKPETLPPPVERRLILYSWATWVYRLIVFTGIALLVYHLFFKLLGVVLFAVEIVWFIALPVARELKVWWGLRRAAIRTHRTLVLGTVVAALLTLLCVPWSGHVRFPAVLGPTQHSTLYAPSAARIARSSLLPGKVVRAGEVLVQLESPALIEEIELSAKRVEFYRLKSLRAATTEEKLSDLRVVMPQLAAERSRLDGLRRQQRKLTLRAPFDGVIRDVVESLHVGRWVDTKLPLAVLVGNEGAEIKGLVAESDARLLRMGELAAFSPEDLTQARLQVTLAELAPADAHAFDLPYLTSTHGGAIPVRSGRDGEVEPVSAVYPVRLGVTAPSAPPAQVIRGWVHVEAEPRSFIGRAYDVIASVLIRESGF